MFRVENKRFSLKKLQRHEWWTIAIVTSLTVFNRTIVVALFCKTAQRSSYLKFWCIRTWSVGVFTFAVPLQVCKLS